MKFTDITNFFTAAPSGRHCHGPHGLTINGNTTDYQLGFFTLMDGFAPADGTREERYTEFKVVVDIWGDCSVTLLTIPTE